ncbi:hypothetical protein [Spiroplasma turonicum]|nr:hypothetical protein [Spiroplasma turonicum]ALX70929.1 hypothetical protein STURO_v1c06700 [Spiroplasma turonicum]
MTKLNKIVIFDLFKDDINNEINFQFNKETNTSEEIFEAINVEKIL